MKRSVLLGLLLTLALTACHRSRSAPGRAAPSIEAVVAAALPSVPLVIQYKSNGKIGFGSGLVVGDDGLILTNLHVVAEGNRLGVMLYDESWPTYTVLEGGLERFLFEQQDKILSASEVARDEGLDLALIRISQSTRGIPRLELATEPPARGDAVFALGHPSETLWSFSSGIVSALPSEMIQHDALVNPGSSGGPLLDRMGRVIGLNTAMVKAARGAGYARPAALLRRFVDREGTALELDRSTLDRAVRTCTRAFELGAMPDACLTEQDVIITASQHDGGATRDVAVQLAVSPQEPHAFEKLDLVHLNVGGVPAMLYLAHAVTMSLNDALEPLPSLRRCDGQLCTSTAQLLTPTIRASLQAQLSVRSPAQRKEAIAAARALVTSAARRSEAHLAIVRAACGLPDWRGTTLRRALQRGWRVVATSPVQGRSAAEPPLTWVLIEGLEGGNGRFQYAELWTREEDHAGFLPFVASRSGWARLLVPADLAATLPSGWPPPLYDDDASITEETLGIARLYLDLSGAESPSSTSRR